MQFAVLAAIILLETMLVLPLRAAAGKTLWKTVAPKGAGFSIAMPDTPKANKLVEKDKAGAVTTNYDWSLEGETAYYMVSNQEHPAAVARLVKPDAMLDEALEGISGGENKGKIISFKKITLNGFPGREVKATLPNGVQLQSKFFWVKHRLYIAMTGYPTIDPAAAKDATKFLNSFKLLARP